MTTFESRAGFMMRIWARLSISRKRISTSLWCRVSIYKRSMPVFAILGKNMIAQKTKIRSSARLSRNILIIESREIRTGRLRSPPTLTSCRTFVTLPTSSLLKTVLSYSAFPLNSYHRISSTLCPRKCRSSIRGRKTMETLFRKSCNISTIQ
jgi:hypothetical protein